MLSPEERRRIAEEVGRYEQRSGACIDALRIVQESRGWVSNESIRDVAEFLEMTCDEVDAVATFYSLIFREPVGRRVLFICDSVTCWVKGCDALRDRIKDRFGIGYGETAADGSLTVLPIACLGTCEHAPVAMLDREMLLDLSPEALEVALKKAIGEKSP